MVAFLVLAPERLLCVYYHVWGAGLHAGAAAEQYKPSSSYSINVIIARHESSVSSEAEAHARLFFVYRPSLCQRLSSPAFDDL